MLWQKFDPEDLIIESILNTDHFIDPTRPSIPVYEYVKPVSISLVSSRPNLKKRPIIKDWFTEPAIKSRVPSISLVPRSVSRQASLSLLPPVPFIPLTSPPPLPPVPAIYQPQLSYKEFFDQFNTHSESNIRGLNSSPLSQNPLTPRLNLLQLSVSSRTSID